MHNKLLQMKQAVSHHQLSIYQYQIGGHHCILNLKQNNQNVLLKPFEVNEFNFYLEMQNIQFVELRQFLPKFYGIEQIDDDDIRKLEQIIIELKSHQGDGRREQKRMKSECFKQNLLEPIQNPPEHIRQKSKSMNHLQKYLTSMIKIESQQGVQSNWIGELYSKRYEKQSKLYLLFKFYFQSKIFKILKFNRKFKQSMHFGFEAWIQLLQSQQRLEPRRYKEKIIKIYQLICGLFVKFSSILIVFLEAKLIYEQIFREINLNKRGSCKLISILFRPSKLNNYPNISAQIINSMIMQFTHLKCILASITNFKFNSASLLLLYDQDLIFSKTIEEFQSKVLAKLIDFGNVIYEEQKCNDNDLNGENISAGNYANQEIITALENVIEIFQEVASLNCQKK